MGWFRRESDDDVIIRLSPPPEYLEVLKQQARDEFQALIGYAMAQTPIGAEDDVVERMRYLNQVIWDKDSLYSDWASDHAYWMTYAHA
jgi:hypothetical protein